MKTHIKQLKKKQKTFISIVIKQNQILKRVQLKPIKQALNIYILNFQAKPKYIIF